MVFNYKKMLFLDPAVIDSSENVDLRVCQPRDRQIVITPDKPWEKNGYITFFSSVIKDNGVYRMYYTNNTDDENVKGGILYAESKDGYHWEKPELGLVSYKGSKANNMLEILAKDGSVIFEPDAPEEERYKFFMHHYTKGTFVHTSADGIHWKLSDKPLCNFMLDSQNVAFFDKRINKYVYYLRGWPLNPYKEGKHHRTVVRGETDDIFKPLEYDKSLTKIFRGDNQPAIGDGEFPDVFAIDELDWYDTDIYTMMPTPYSEAEGYYLAFPSFFRHGYNHKSDGKLEVMFAGSSDGIHWHRYDRSAYVQNEVFGRFYNNIAFMGLGVHREGDRLLQYGTILGSRHGAGAERMGNPDAGGKIVCYEQRLDGFVCAKFAVEGGSLTTCPWECTGTELVVNVDAGMLGYLKIGIYNEDNSVIEGYTIDDCKIIEENGIDVKVTFNGGDLKQLNGKKIRLKIEGANARLFSLKMQ